MVGPRRFLRALAATWVLGTGLALAVPVPAPAAAAAVPTARADADETDDAPLGVTIRSMTPGALPATGNIEVNGTVTNRTDEPWSSISLYVVDGGFVDAPVEPMRTPAQLRKAMTTAPDDVVGSRITTVGTFGSVDELAPGASAPYTILVPATALKMDRAGVYWFGVHALGSSESFPGDNVADGRARTFIPYVPSRYDTTPVTVSVVVPLTRLVRYAPDGSVADSGAWARDLDHGRLARLLELVGDSPGPVTWLVDPALVDAVAHLAAGNRPRALGPTEGAETEPSDGPTTEAAPLTDSEAAVAEVATDWLDRLDDELEGDEVLTLPYGNVDVAATLDRDPELLALALAQRSDTLESLDVDARPVLTAPNGYLDADTVAAADPDTRVLVTDRMLGADAPVVADVDGHRVLTSSYGVTQGSPGPGTSLNAVGLRQRLLSEAALRVVRSDREPLVAVLPVGWNLTDPTTFWNGLDAPWIDLAPLSGAEAATTPVDVGLDDLDYPEDEERRELGPMTIDGVADLIGAGDTLQNLLLDNTGIAGTITEEALTGLSYNVRYDQGAGRQSTTGAHGWVSDRLADVEIDAPDGVTLASDQGTFVVTLTNGLDHRVAVSVRARTDDGIEVTAPKRVVLAAGARDTVRLTTRTTTNSVHNVELMVTDQSGTPLGSTSDLPIRSTQVGGVIWIIIGVGAAILFLAIILRLVRRVGAARRGDPGAGRRSTQARAADDEPHPVEAV